MRSGCNFTLLQSVFIIMSTQVQILKCLYHHIVEYISRVVQSVRYRGGCNLFEKACYLHREAGSRRITLCRLIACCPEVKGRLRLLNYNVDTTPTLMTSGPRAAISAILHNHRAHKTTILAKQSCITEINANKCDKRHSDMWIIQYLFLLQV